MERLAFSSITIDGKYYPKARGEMYGRPRPEVVEASITFPYNRDHMILSGHWVRISARCNNGIWMRDILGLVTGWKQVPCACSINIVHLYRKSSGVLPNDNTPEMIQLHIKAAESDVESYKRVTFPGEAIDRSREKAIRHLEELRKELAQWKP